MLSVLLQACSEGNIQAVTDLLRDVNPNDGEVRDESGSTPLIEAVKNGHVEVVRILLDKGADPSNGSPEQHTTDQGILNLLAQAKNMSLLTGVPAAELAYPHDSNDDSQKAYYPPPPPEAYPYYPTINPSLSTVPDGSGFYPPPPPPQAMSESHSPGGLGNLPPLEVARFIPCRYFPACRYGPSCIFAHPPQNYYPAGGPPPTQYPPYEPMAAPPYPPNYYPPPNFQQPNGPHPMAPMSPPPGPPHMVHGRSASEVVTPTQGPFSPNGVPPPVPYGPMSPSVYPHQAQMPVPLPVPPPPSLHHQPQMPPPGPHSPTNFAPSPATPFNVQPEGPGMYPPQQPPLPNGHVNFPPEVDGMLKPPQPAPEGFNNGVSPVHRDGPIHTRRGGRRASFGKPRPPCLFFPAGRCKNGDDCRFPHVMPDGITTPTAHHTPYYAGRGGGPRQPRGHAQPNGIGNGHGLEEKFNNMNIRDESSRQQASATQTQQSQNGQNGVDAPRPLNATDGGPVNGNGNIGIGGRPRYPQGGKHHHYPHHGYNSHFNQGKGQKLPISQPKQRVPNADEFPVLGGTITPPTRSPLTTTGPTAAQVLQAPPPTRKDGVATNGTGKEPSSTRGTTPDRSRSPVTSAKDGLKAGVNGVDDSMPSEPSVNKRPISFAAVATATTVAPPASSATVPDVSKEVSVSA